VLYSWVTDTCIDTFAHSSSSWHRWTEASSNEDLAWLGTKGHRWCNDVWVTQTSLGVCSWQHLMRFESTHMLIFRNKSMILYCIKYIKSIAIVALLYFTGSVVTQGAMRSMTQTLLRIDCWVQRWKNSENRSTVFKVTNEYWLARVYDHGGERFIRTYSSLLAALVDTFIERYTWSSLI